MAKQLALFFLLLGAFQFTTAQSSAGILESKKDFDKFMGLPLSGKYGKVYSVKLLYDLENEKLYFINQKFADFHYRFCNNYLQYGKGLGAFNEQNYSTNPQRSYLLGNLNYIQALDKYVLELSSVDLMESQDIIRFYALIKEAFYAKKDLYFLVNTSRLQRISKKLSSKIPTLNPSDIYGASTYQAISKNNATGTLKFINDFNSEKDSIKEYDIIVLKETPLYLPKVAGVILTEFQTPLSHMAVLGLNRRIPIIAHKNAFSDKSLLKLEGKRIRFRVYSDSFKVHSVPKSNRYKPRYKVKDLKYDLSVDSILETKYLDEKAKTYVGNKAANFAVLQKLSITSNFKVPESSFAIPFRYYINHVKESKAQEVIEKVIFSSAIKNNSDSLKFYLSKIRKHIKGYHLSATLLRQVEGKITELGDFRRMRFRSSTNAEDAYGFSGAGIYRSATGTLNDTNKSIEKAIKKVWASLWSYEAFSEREIFHINHSQVFMGVLVHRSFPNEKANGVAITKNLYRDNSYGFVVNVQLGEHSVVKPEKGVTCDQFVCYPNLENKIYKDKNAVDIITKSSLNNGNMVMTTQEIINLAAELKAIKNRFYSLNNHGLDFLAYGIGVEFKLDGKSQQLYVKQARFYND